MFYHRLFVLSIILLSFITSALFGAHNTPLPSRWDDMLVKHKWNAIPGNWVSLGRPAEGTTIDLYIALKPNRENALIDALHEVSQPEHPKYGAHLSREQVAELVAPHPHTLQLVGAWLEFNSVPPSSISRTHGGGWLTVTGVPVDKANELLGASYQLYYHASTNDTILRTDSYALPAPLHTHVGTVAPTTSFTPSDLQKRTPRSSPGAAAAANATSGESMNMLSRRDEAVTPSMLRWLYKTAAFNPVDPSLVSQRKIALNRIGIVGYENQYPSETDLSDFMSIFRDEGGLPTIDYKLVNNNLPSSFMPSYLANLGAQYTSALAYPTPIVYYVGISGPGDKYLEWISYVINNSRPPQTISLAYGSVSELSISREYADEVCELLGQFGARGISILVASGDSGVGLGDCINAYGYPQFYTSFPASCPYVTSVGGTFGGTTSPEIANSFSGGGFSAYFPRPDFQDVLVTNYVDSLNLDVYPDMFHREGRGVPDIALQSANFRMLLNRQYYDMDGTSCSTHTAAAIVSLLNGHRIANRERPLGFLNPWLYGRARTGFKDIKSGNNPGCNTVGFSATVGWDPVTGLGSPNFLQLQSIVRNRKPKQSQNAK